MDITIRPCRPGDAAALAAVGQATFLETYAGIVDGADILAHAEGPHSTATYEDYLADPACQLFLAVCPPGEAPVGYTVFCPPDLPVAIHDGDIELKRIYVLHRFHGEKVGPRLLQAGLDWARTAGFRRVLLGAYGENHRALAFYRRSGFEQVGTRKIRVGVNDYDDVVLATAL
ncbi:ribosomal protein S18 acetylase RimI-like enzyme [Caulobacter ginsengisoli]|uniref:Ribosomal protein S18 acetylase RimI-like enzyme n=1 Tax=Caulobacter ginsengisoli TaxID=400775 RepID=A0ABU0IVS0_9CAUL|nr:GNAT family N-acetyltransferase [Caulobacter ginsengisoli]MDQ0466103.1 ribosomal protein S18 acetylase RimI-like enzyme [Caulobacter ginsengisoli]